MPPKSARTSKTLTTVLLSTKGEVKKANITSNEDGEITLETIQKYFRKKDLPEEICHYSYRDRKFVLIGYKKGKAGTENKHSLPAPHDKHPKFGDIIIIQVNNGDNWSDSPLPMTSEQWRDFIENQEQVDEAGSDDGDDDDEDDDEDEEGEHDAFEEDDEELDVDEDDEDNDDEDDDESDQEELEEELEEEPEPEPQVVRRRKNTIHTIKVDSSVLQEEVDENASASSHTIRQVSLVQFQFLAEHGFESDAITALEMAVYQHTIEYAKRQYVPRNWKSVQFQELYKQCVRQILWNLHPKSPVKNPRLLRRILDGEFPLSHLASMSAYDMYPEHWSELADKQLIREQKILEGNKSRATDQYKCHRCGKRECTYYEMQTRSADEPMTIFITCINCGKQWRN
jgi:transcription elongation factor S-II